MYTHSLFLDSDASHWPLPECSEVLRWAGGPEHRYRCRSVGVAAAFDMEVAAASQSKDCIERCLLAWKLVSL